MFLNAVSISPIRNPINQITHYIGTQVDVTHRGNPATGEERAGQEPVTTPRRHGRFRPGTAA